MTPLEFCEARLSTDEERARAVRTWGDPGPYDPIFAHIRRHDPERTVRRCAAERALLAAAPDLAPVMATTWQDHADFDPAWVETGEGEG